MSRNTKIAWALGGAGLVAVGLASPAEQVEVVDEAVVEAAGSWTGAMGVGSEVVPVPTDVEAFIIEASYGGTHGQVAIRCKTGWKTRGGVMLHESLGTDSFVGGVTEGEWVVDNHWRETLTGETGRCDALRLDVSEQDVQWTVRPVVDSK